MENGLQWGVSMREKSECQTHASHVRGTTEMCSRDPPVLHPALTKANCKTSNHQSAHHNDSSSDSNVLPTPGGRLKFFKDGKFILELSHRRDGERTTWFPVPKKTFWPPASTTPNRQESSTSLSGKALLLILMFLCKYLLYININYYIFIVKDVY